MVVGLDAAQMALDAYQVGEGFEFNPGQRDMFFRWVCGGNQVDLVVGAAGTGKRRRLTPPAMCGKPTG